MRFTRKLPLVAAVALMVSPMALASGDGAPHWTYAEGEDGPQHWAALDHSFEACEEGRQQSPVNVVPTIHADLPAIDFRYGEIPTEIVNNGHTLQVTVPFGQGIKVDGHDYELVQFHFHTPSEYHIEGKAYPLELHLVHKDKEGHLAVVGVMIAEGGVNTELEDIFWGGPEAAGTTKRLIDVKTDLGQLIPKDGRYFRFMGSLTTPPCSEGVNWHIMTTPITASAMQIEKFRAMFPMNARPLQPLNDRLVVEDTN